MSAGLGVHVYGPCLDRGPRDQHSVRGCAQDGPQEDRAVGGVVLEAVALVADDKAVPLADLLADLLRHVKAGNCDLALSQGPSQLLLYVLRGSRHSKLGEQDACNCWCSARSKAWNVTASSWLRSNVHSHCLILIHCEIPIVDTAKDGLLWVPMHEHWHASLQSEYICVAGAVQLKGLLTEPLMIVTTWRSMGDGSQVCRADSQSRRSVEGQIMSRGQSSLKAAAIMIACNSFCCQASCIPPLAMKRNTTQQVAMTQGCSTWTVLPKPISSAKITLALRLTPNSMPSRWYLQAIMPLAPTPVSKDQTSSIAARTKDSRKQLVPGLLRQLREALLHCFLGQHRHQTLLFLQLRNRSHS